MNIFKLEFKLQIRSILLWSGITSLMLIAFMSLFPSMQNEAMKAIGEAKLKSMPPAVLAAFGITEITDFTVLTNYFSVVMQYINLVICIFAAIIGANSLIKEETDGTIEYIYAQPVKRADIVKYKMLASVLVFSIIPITLAIITGVIFTMFNEGKIPFMELLGDIILTYVGLFFAGIIFMSIGFLSSSLQKSSKQSSPFALGIVFATFLIGILSNMVKDVEFLVVLSPLDLVKPNKLIADGFNISGVLVGVVIIAVCTTLCFVFYNRKDLMV